MPHRSVRRAVVLVAAAVALTLVGGDWRITSSAAALDAFRAGLATY
jgi:hypothetical protein